MIGNMCVFWNTLGCVQSHRVQLVPVKAAIILSDLLLIAAIIAHLVSSRH